VKRHEMTQPFVTERVFGAERLGSGLVVGAGEPPAVAEVRQLRSRTGERDLRRGVVGSPKLSVRIRQRPRRSVGGSRGNTNAVVQA
jgi:hypothetical protein